MLKYHVQCGKWGYTPNPIAWHPHKMLLATGSTLNYQQRHDVTIWNMDGVLQKLLKCHSYVHEIKWVCHGQMLAVRANEILLWHENFTFLRKIPGLRMAWNPVYPQLISYSIKTGAWHLWDLTHATNQILCYRSEPQEFKDNLHWSPCGKYCIGVWNQTESSNIEICIWQKNGQMLSQNSINSTQNSQVIESIWHPTKLQIVIRMELEVIIVDLAGQVLNQWDLISDQREWEDGVCFQWSPDGAILAQANQTKIQLRPLNGQQISIELESNVQALGWHPTSQFLAIAPWNNQIQLWDKNGKHLATFITDVEEVGARMIMIPLVLEWDRTGRYLAASLRGCTVHLWKMQ